MNRLLIALLLALAAPATAQQCEEVRFQRGAYSGEISGVLRGGEADCYTIGTGTGNIMRMEVLDGPTTWFMIPGATGGIERFHTFTTFQDRYYFEVRSFAPRGYSERYQILVTIR